MEPKVDYLFCITTGRSGSDYVSQLFSHVVGCAAFHEPVPVGNGEAMRSYLAGDPDPMRRVVQQKVENIKAIRRDGRIYVETNHCFIKGFGWLIPEYLPEERIGVLILSRDRSKIAESTFRVGSSPLEPNGRDWVMTPGVKIPLVAPPQRLVPARATYFLFRALRWFLRSEKLYRRGSLPPSQGPKWMLRYELECLHWYVDETTARSQAYQERFNKMKYYAVDVEQLNTLDEVRTMLAYFGCMAKESIRSVIGRPTNLKRSTTNTSALISGFEMEHLITSRRN